MKLRFPLLTTSALMLALAAPGVLAKDNGKGKGKDKEKKAKVERVSNDDGRDDDDDDDGRNDRNGKRTICHIPPGNSSARHTITVSESAWQAHRKHGDHTGACGNGSGNGNDNDGDGRANAFRDLDRNDDGRVSRGEWPHGDDSFRRLDRNGDGALSLGEYRRR